MKMLRLANNVANARPQLRPLALFLHTFAICRRQTRVRVAPPPRMRRLWLGWCLFCFTPCSLSLVRWTAADAVCPPSLVSPTPFQPPHRHERGVSNNESRLAGVTTAENQFPGWGSVADSDAQVSVSFHSGDTGGVCVSFFSLKARRINRIMSYLLNFCLFTWGRFDAK